jgi:hypothetical protein
MRVLLASEQGRDALCVFDKAVHVDFQVSMRQESCSNGRAGRQEKLWPQERYLSLTPFMELIGRWLCAGCTRTLLIVKEPLSVINQTHEQTQSGRL